MFAARSRGSDGTNYVAVSSRESSHAVLPQSWPSKSTPRNHVINPYDLATGTFHSFQLPLRFPLVLGELDDRSALRTGLCSTMTSCCDRQAFSVEHSPWHYRTGDSNKGLDCGWSPRPSTSPCIDFSLPGKLLLLRSPHNQILECAVADEFAFAGHQYLIVRHCLVAAGSGTLPACQRKVFRPRAMRKGYPKSYGYGERP